MHRMDEGRRNMRCQQEKNQLGDIRLMLKGKKGGGRKLTTTHTPPPRATNKRKIPSYSPKKKDLNNTLIRSINRGRRKKGAGV